MRALLFDELLDLLKTEGFAVAVDRRLRVQQLVHLLDEPAELTTMRTLLRPLIARSPDEQQKFDEVFDEYLRRYVGIAVEEHPRGPDGTGPGVELGPRGAVEPPPSRFKRTALLIAALLAIVIVAGMVYRTRSKKPAPIANPQRSQSQLPQTQIQPRLQPQLQQGTSASQSRPARNQPPPIPPLRSDLSWHEAIARKRRLLTALSLLLGGVLIFDLARVAARRSLRRAKRGQETPYRWPLRSADVSELFDTPAVDDAVRQLRRQAAGDRVQLDLEKTIRATTTSGGHVRFVHVAARQSPGYIVLIERLSSDDQQADYFAALTAALAAREVDLALYWFESDPRFCADPRGARITIQEIRQRHPSWRLLMMGSGDSLVDPFRGELRDWMESDLDFTSRGILLPEWSGIGVEIALSRAIVAARGDGEGLLQLAEGLDAAQGVRRQSAHSNDEDAMVGAQPSVRELRRVLDAETFRWLAACALHPELHWDLTIRIGRLLFGALDARRLLQLVRLRWFREGLIPDARREELIEEFRNDPAFRTTHLAMASVLAEQPPPRGSYAAEVQSMRSVTHRILAADLDRDVRPLLRELRMFSTALVRGNDELAPILAAPEVYRGATLSVLTRRLLFRGAAPALGVRNFVWSVIVALIGIVVATVAVASLRIGYAPPQTSSPRKPIVRPRPVISPPDFSVAPPPETPPVLPPSSSSLPGTTSVPTTVVPTTVPTTVPTARLIVTPRTEVGVTSVAPIGPLIAAPRPCLVLITPANPSGYSAEFPSCAGLIDYRAGQTATFDWPEATISFETGSATSLPNGQTQIAMTLRSDEHYLSESPIMAAGLLSLNGQAFNAIVNPDYEKPCPATFVDLGTVEGRHRLQVTLSICEVKFPVFERGIAGFIGFNRLPVEVMSSRATSTGMVIDIAFDGTPEGGEATPLQLGPRTYSLEGNVVAPQQPPPQSSPAASESAPEVVLPSILAPPYDAEVRVGKGQKIVFSWTDTGAPEYRFSCFCIRQEEFKMTVKTPYVVWAPPIEEAAPLCLWSVSVQRGEEWISRDGAFRLQNKTAFEVENLTIARSTISVKAKASSLVKTVVVNDVAVKIQRGHFNIAVPVKGDPTVVVIVATMTNGVVLSQTLNVNTSSRGFTSTVPSFASGWDLSMRALVQSEDDDSGGVLDGDADADGDQTDAAGDFHRPTEALPEKAAEGGAGSGEEQRHDADHRQRDGRIGSERGKRHTDRECIDARRNG